MSRKGLALTLATLMIWAVSVPAFAVVEPFPDVPQDHWAYEAIESLRLAGLIEGYPDGTFGGARTFTRYEMAMVFSRILERLQAWLAGREDFLISSATGELLAALGDEFAPELEQMGISSTEYGRLLQAVAAVQADAEAAADSRVPGASGRAAGAGHGPGSSRNRRAGLGHRGAGVRIGRGQASL